MILSLEMNALKVFLSHISHYDEVMGKCPQLLSLMVQKQRKDLTRGSQCQLHTRVTRGALKSTAACVSPPRNANLVGLKSNLSIQQFFTDKKSLSRT